MMAGNRGEWSEVYTLMKLLADGRVYAADENLEKMDDVFYPIIKIIRNETGNCEVYYNIESSKDKKCTENTPLSGGNIMITTEKRNGDIVIPISKFKKFSKILLDKIRYSQGSSFFIEEIDEFLKIINCGKLKASSKDKTDIKMMVHDLKTGVNPTLGFSIKSMLGNPSTLLNTSNATNFTYEITGIQIDGSKIDRINSIETKRKVRDRLQLIYEYGGDIKYHDVENIIFKSNLQMIDSNLPVMLSEMIKSYYGGPHTNTADLLSELNNINPCHYPNTSEHQFYHYKIKSLYTDIALGMTPASVWTGAYDATGGYMIVKESGEVVCYHIYNRNEFQ
jgi:type II restriction enzyme